MTLCGWISFLVALTLISASTAYEHTVEECSTRICPLPQCTVCPSHAELSAPSVGIALETSHGTAVVRLHDGTYHPIALLAGDAAYIALLRDLATGPLDRQPDPNDPTWSRWHYLKRRAMRYWNKSIGRPATPETAVLSAMVSDLIDATQAWLGPEHPIAAAVLSSPHRVRLTDEETNDIFDYLRLRNLMSEPDNLDALYATSAAYAGYGFGLCPNYTDAYTCEQEECRFDYQDVLHVDFNSESLSGTIDGLLNFRSWGASQIFVDFELGAEKRDIDSGMKTPGWHDVNDLSSPNWSAVSTRIRDFVSSYHRRINRLLLTGPSAIDPTFKAALNAALHDLVDESVLSSLECRSGSDEVDNEDAWRDLLAFATARGAAEVAKRRQEGPVRCHQTVECRQRRDRVYQR